MMRVRTYDVIARAVEDGVERGWRLAHKHTPKPPEQAVRDAIEQAVMNEICTWIEFDERSAPAEESDLRSAGRDRGLSPSQAAPVPSSGIVGLTATIGGPHGSAVQRNRERQAAKESKKATRAQGRARGVRGGP